jgi:hypothetical protein
LIRLATYLKERCILRESLLAFPTDPSAGLDTTLEVLLISVDEEVENDRRLLVHSVQTQSEKVVTFGESVPWVDYPVSMIDPIDEVVDVIS